MYMCANIYYFKALIACNLLLNIFAIRASFHDKHFYHMYSF